ncbi:MAG: phosphoribosylformylglycinamidine synthase [Clostridium sp.]|jgi:phosphoribosylformylglycinamidine synthase|nr:phosphoribosylformylglycinamidine synthase [Clostridium sp.]
MSNIRRVFVEKKQPYAVKAKELLEELRGYLRIESLSELRIWIRYDVEAVSDAVFAQALSCVFSEPPVDDLYEEELPTFEGRVFGVEYLPGQFDQRADSAMQCIQLLNEKEEPLIKTATIYGIVGDCSEEEFARIVEYCMNPVDSRLAAMEKPDTLVSSYEEPDDVSILTGFRALTKEQAKDRYDAMGLAMTFRDFLHIQKYFTEEEKRDPFETEIRVLDTYWSDHCRHTTFSTRVNQVEFEEGTYKTPIETAYRSYLDSREELYGDRKNKPICLMDLALMAMKQLKAQGKLQDLEESEEINACSIIVPVEETYEDGSTHTQEWLVFFKNETHNHPTEIEPFGGAATCLGGAIRDPLSGRGYVYQAMRVTGAHDPNTPIEQTIKGKLPQMKLVRTAAAGYSSYGNQIGLATGLVKEIYHPGYVAKRMEIGAVIGAAPRKNVVRKSAAPGDVIILLGGRTGRDGLGGATGSSKIHTEESTALCGAEVQKGNPPTERKIQRLFRNEQVSRLIKKCNDFGAGGVSVAIGELADGIFVDLDLVPKKYTGLGGTELAISESQERMAVMVDPSDVESFLAHAAKENIEAVVVARVTQEPRLVLQWRGKKIVDLARSFLDTNGALQETNVLVKVPSDEHIYFERYANDKVRVALDRADVTGAWLASLEDLNVCSQKGLVEMFDSTIGAATVLFPYGGKYQLTESQAMAAKLPMTQGQTDTVTLMSYGYDPYLSEWSPYHGAIYAVLESMAKIVAVCGDPNKIHFTFQEYFGRMSEDPARWSQPFSALLGAYDAQMGFGLASVGGKDSMSGTFQNLDVPPTLVSFAVAVGKENQILTQHLKQAGNQLIEFRIRKDEYDVPMYESVLRLYEGIHKLIEDGILLSCYAADSKGVAVALSKAAFGNHLGVAIDASRGVEDLFANSLGNLIAEISPQHMEALEASGLSFTRLGSVIAEEAFIVGSERIPLDKALASWTNPLEKVFPTRSSTTNEELTVDMPPVDSSYTTTCYVCQHKVARPTVLIPVFPGSNCEYDTARAFERAGAQVHTFIFRNQSASDILESVQDLANAIDKAQILMFPGGFSAGDEPDGSAKFFAAAFRNPLLQDAVNRLLKQRDGLALGICNGFQAMIKLGLVPYGEIVGQTPDSPTLTYNTINRHISKMVHTKVVSKRSPWLMEADLGATYITPVSHGEGRFVASNACLDELFTAGQVATQYADPNGTITMDEAYNINGSYAAIEGITSKDGRCFGKMAHAERRDRGVLINIVGEQDLKIFESGVKYFQ